MHQSAVAFSSALTHLESYYCCMSQNAGLAQGKVGSIRWYDWISSDRIVRIFFAEQADDPDLPADIVQCLAGRGDDVSVITSRPFSSALGMALESCGLEVSLQPVGMECTKFKKPDEIVSTNECQFMQVGLGLEIEEYARVVCINLMGNIGEPSIAGFTRALRNAVQNESLSLHAVTDSHGHVVSSCAVYPCDELQGIYQVATVPEWRGKGLATALVASVLAGLDRAKTKKTVLQVTSPIARHIYEQLGFQQTISYCRWTRRV